MIGLCLWPYNVSTAIASRFLSAASILNASVKSVGPRLNPFQTTTANARRSLLSAHAVASSRILAFAAA